MSATFYLFLIVLGLVGAGFYVVLFVREVPGFAEQRFGKLEPLPEDVGKWRADTESDAARAAEREGLRREIRHWYDSDQNRLLLQARYRSADTNEIVRVDPDVVVRRKRVRG